MIVEFSVANTYSIKEEQTISFESIDEKARGLHRVNSENKNLLKLACVYGANASGKTQMLKALDFYLQVMLDSYDLPLGEKLEFDPFLFDSACKDGSGSFKLHFVIDGLGEFKYSLKINKTDVLNESLHKVVGGKGKRIFSRTQKALSWGDEYKKHSSSNKLVELTVKDRKEHKGRSNCSIMSLAYKANHLILAPITKSLKEGYCGFVGTRTTPYARCTDLETDEVYKKAVLAFMNNVDIGKISDISVTKNDGVFSFPQIYMHHSYGNDDSLPIDAESAGTKRIIPLLKPLVDMVRRNALVIIDELDVSMHQDLLNLYLKIFLNKSKNSQILFSTHNQDLLESELLLDDEIWFCTKNANGASEYSSLTDYSDLPLGEVSRKKIYNAGNVGALPMIDELAVMEAFDA